LFFVNSRYFKSIQHADQEIIQSVHHRHLTNKYSQTQLTRKNEIKTKFLLIETLTNIK
jgi:hypothetical protein